MAAIGLHVGTQGGPSHHWDAIGRAQAQTTPSVLLSLAPEPQLSGGHLGYLVFPATQVLTEPGTVTV